MNSLECLVRLASTALIVTVPTFLISGHQTISSKPFADQKPRASVVTPHSLKANICDLSSLENSIASEMNSSPSTLISLSPSAIQPFGLLQARPLYQNCVEPLPSQASPW